MVDKVELLGYISAKCDIYHREQKLFPQIMEILVHGGYYRSGDTITEFGYEDNKYLWIDHAETIRVSVIEGDGIPGVRYFPARYLYMTIEEIDKEYQMQQEMEYRNNIKDYDEDEYQQYLKLKEKYGDK